MQTASNAHGTRPLKHIFNGFSLIKECKQRAEEDVSCFAAKHADQSFLLGLACCSAIQSIVDAVQEALAAQNASYVPGMGPLAGKATLHGSGADAQLDLGGLAERVWAVELAALHRAAADAAAEERRR